MTAFLTLFAAAALAEAGPWSDPASGLQVAFPDGWTWTPGGAVLDGQLVQATHTPTGGGAVVRVEPFDAAALPEVVRARIGDVAAALSADRYAEALALSQTDGSADRTLYLGFSDTAGARVGRWVFYEPATGTDPARIWWHAFWQQGDQYGQLVAWVPEDRFTTFLPAMRALEASLGTTTGYSPPAALLVKHEGACDGPASVDRMAAIAASGPYADARAALRDGAWTADALALAEIRALGALVAGVDGCVRQRAREVRACTVHEKASDTARSQRLQAEVTACLADDKATKKGLETALQPR